MSPVTAVDLVEIGDVEQEQRHLTPAALRPRERNLQTVCEQRAGGETGERIVKQLLVVSCQSPLSLDRVADGAYKLVAVDSALDEVVLSARRNRLSRQRIILEAGEHHDRDIRVGRAQPFKALETSGIGQRQIKQRTPRANLQETVAGIPHQTDVVEADRSERSLIDHRSDEHRVAGVILDKQDPGSDTAPVAPGRPPGRPCLRTDARRAEATES